MIMGHDNMDYDGMGNYGRFPPEQQQTKSEKRNRLSDIILIIGCLSIFIYYLTQ